MIDKFKEKLEYVNAKGTRGEPVGIVGPDPRNAKLLFMVRMEPTAIPFLVNRESGLCVHSKNYVRTVAA